MADTSITYNVFAKFHGDESRMRKFGAAATLVGVAVGALAVKFGKDSVGAYVEAEEAQKKLEFAFEKFPALADTNIESLRNLNTEWARKTKFDDDNIASGQAVLAQFKLTGKQLTEVTPLLLDYASKTGKDIPGAAMDVGKALLGNAKALKNIGISYKSTGDATQDYANITALMREKVGGFAEKEGVTAAGQAAILKNQFGELEEGVGSKLVPVLMHLATALLGVVGFMQHNATTMKIAGTAVLALATGIGALVAISKVQMLILAMQTEGTLAYSVAQKAGAIWTAFVTAAQWAWNAALIVGAAAMAVLTSPITLVVLGIGLLVAAIILAYKHSETFRNIVHGAFHAVATAGQFMWDVLKSAFGFIVNAWLSVAGMIVHGAEIAFGWIPIIGDKLHSAADKFDQFAATVRAALSGGAKIGADFVAGVAAGIRNTTGLAVGAAGDMSNRIAAAAKQQLRERSPSQVGYEIGDFFVQGVEGGIKDKTAATVEAVKALTDKVTAKLQELRQKAAEIRSAAAGAVSGMFNFGDIGKTTTGTDAEGNPTSTTASPVQQFADFAAQSKAFAGAVSTAVAHGLDPRVVAQAVGTGNLTVVQALANLDPASTRSVNRDFALAQKFAAQVGQTVLSTTPLPDQIAREQGQLDTLKAIRADLKAQRPIEIHVHDATDPDAVVAAIRRYIKKNGLLRNVAAP